MLRRYFHLLVIICLIGWNNDRLPEKTVQEIILPGVDMTKAIKDNDSVMIACRIPVRSNAQILIKDDSSGSVLVTKSVVIYDQKPSDNNPEMVDTSDWIFWPVNSKKHMNTGIKLPNHITIVLKIFSDSGNIWGGEFGTFRGTEFKKISRSSAAPDPGVLSNKLMLFNYRIDADADVKIEILPLNTKQPTVIFTDRKIDIPAGLKTYSWNFRKSNGTMIAAGEYYVRFRCNARNSNQQINDICIPFRVIP